MTALLLALTIGYAVGSASPAALIARARGVDLRASGSGNPGATNAGRLLGRKVGVVVALLDVSKAVLPAAVFGMVDHEAGLLAGAAAVAGHITSPWLKGRGGKGAAAAGGAVLGSHPLWAIPVIGIWAVVALSTRWVALGSICAAIALPVLALVFEPSAADVAWAVAIGGVVIVRHRANVTRWWSARRSR